MSKTDTQKCEHNWQKLHPEDDYCLVCFWEGQKEKVIEKYPHWSESQIEDKLDHIMETGKYL